MQPTLDAWKKIRVYFDFYFQQDLESNKETAEAENMDLSDLPTYDEEYTPIMRHQKSLTMFVRNLEKTTDEQFADYLANLNGMIPDHAQFLSDHERIMHDELDCPTEDVDPFEQNDAISYTKALIDQDKDDEDEEVDLFKDLYNTEGLDNETREL